MKKENTMTNFKEHDGMIFKMLEEPVPLTPETEMPCLVRLIQDDSPMGKHNKDLHAFDPKRLTPKICTEVIDVNDLSDPNRGSARCDGFMSIQYYRYELIGTHVKEGSDEWALYQIMNGKKVCHHKSPSIMYCEHAGYIRREVRHNCVDHMSVSVWLNGADKNGWQIYTEPNEEPQYKVGDWVKYDIDSYLQVIEPSGKERTLCKTLSGVGVIVYPYTSLLTKASPSEVVVHIGCMSGTVLFVDADRFILRGIGKSEMANACIMFKMLDAATCVLVESLLKAQNEEKRKGDNND
ncbi:MAG: hypothetical protein RBT65_12590 [Methanolobus sp.]|nr:hypothetical protein [Methanolobus sp.]